MKRSFNLGNLELQAAGIKRNTAPQWMRVYSPGLGLTALLAGLAVLLQKLPGTHLFSPLILAIVLGVLLGNTIGISQVYQPGIQLALKRVLKLAVILLGLQMSLSQMLSVGWLGCLIVGITVVTTLVFTIWLGRRLKVPMKLVQLIAVGTSICGASAVVATNTVVDDSEENVAYAVAMVTAFGTCSMLLYPSLFSYLQLTAQAFGVWCGVSIHEVAQVVAAAFQVDRFSGELATLTKLSRVILLAPVVLGLNVLAARVSTAGQRVSGKQFPVPWFVLYFLLLIGINSLGLIPPAVKATALPLNQFLLAMAMAAMGLETHLHRLQQSGWKPFYLAAASWLFISSLSLLLVKMLYPNPL